MEPRIPGFEILAPLGHGAMSSVWRARELANGRIVALKVLHPHAAISPVLLERFIQELRAYERLRHANIISCFADGRAGDVWYVVLELLEGGDLRGLLGVSGRLPPETAAFVLSAVLCALGHAHRAGLVHRDVKPENVMFAADGTVKLADFGVSIASDFARLTESGSLVGTPAYMSPEQIRTGESTARSDLWSAGVLLYEMLTGRNPFAAEHPSLTLLRLASLTPAPPGYRSAGVPERLDDVSAALLAREREDRPGSAEEVVEQLRPVVDAGGMLATSEGLMRLLADPAGALAAAAAMRCRERLDRARSLLSIRPPRPAAAFFEAAEALQIDPRSEEARQLARDAGARAAASLPASPSPRVIELESEAEAEGASLRPLLNLVRVSRADGDLHLAGRAYRWGRRRSGDDHFAFAQLVGALGLELGAHLEGLHPESLERRLRGRSQEPGIDSPSSAGAGAGAVPGVGAGRPLLRSPAVWASFAALAVAVAWAALSPPAVNAPQPRASRRAVRPTPTPPDAYEAVLERAAAVADEGDPERAIAIYGIFLAERPADRRVPEVRFRAARALEELERDREAIAAYREILDRWPESVVTTACRRRLALRLEALRDFDGALEALQPLGEGPDLEAHASLVLQRARLHERRGDLEQALALYTTLEDAPAAAYVRAQARLGHGRILVMRGNPEARRWLHEAISEAGAGSRVGLEAQALEEKLSRAEAEEIEKLE